MKISPFLTNAGQVLLRMIHTALSLHSLDLKLKK